MSQSFTKKVINVTFTLGTGTFGTSGSNQKEFTGLRVSCDIAKAGGVTKGALSMRIYGLTQSDMLQLTKAGRVPQETQLNLVKVDAGDVNGVATIFQGSIRYAWADFSDPPEVAFIVDAQAGYWEAIKPAQALSFSGPVDAAFILSQLASSIGADFQNNGVSVILRNANYSGSAWDQIEQVTRDANVLYSLDNNVLAIWPQGGARTQYVTNVSPETGLIGYPLFSAQTMTVKTIFSPTAQMGGLINVTSSLPPACGMWRVFSLAHNLESERPNGQWFTTAQCSRVDSGLLTAA